MHLESLRIDISSVFQQAAIGGKIFEVISLEIEASFDLFLGNQSFFLVMDQKSKDIRCLLGLSHLALSHSDHILMANHQQL